MKTTFLSLLAFSILCLSACTKQPLHNEPAISENNFTQYHIPQGQHYSTTNSFKNIDVTELKFSVRFDSSCIYTTVLPENQYDINKLYGFADNNALHHQFSARFGWRWSDGGLRLFAYVYNNGQRISEEITTLDIGKSYNCAIKVLPEVYQFRVEDQVLTMPRASTTASGKGYLLYPYFGGDETAPHPVNIWIRDLK